MVLILSIAGAAASALAIWHRLRSAGDASAVSAVAEARRSAGIVNAVSYAFAIILDAMVARRVASYGVAGSSSESTRRFGTPVKELAPGEA